MSIIVLNIYEPMNLYIPLHPNHVKIKKKNKQVN